MGLTHLVNWSILTKKKYFNNIRPNRDLTIRQTRKKKGEGEKEIHQNVHVEERVEQSSRWVWLHRSCRTEFGVVLVKYQLLTARLSEESI